MMEIVEANWLAFALALIIGLLVAWWIFRRASTGPVRTHTPDVLDEGAAPAARNQALIDAPTAAAVAIGPGILGGIGEVIAVAAQDEAEAAIKPVAPPAHAAAEEADDLSRIKGLGPKLVGLLGTLGVTRFDQIAAWDDAEIDRIDAQLGTFAGRIRRDSWVEQARYLARGDVAGFEARFGNV